MSGGFPIDLVLFGMIAAFLVLRLRGILGRRTGFERPSQPERTAAPAADPRGARPAAPAETRPVAAARALPDAGSPAGLTLARMQTVDRTFDAQRFLGGAEAAFRLIVAGFAAGDRVQLRALLGDDTYRSFETAIAAREAAGETQRSEIRSVEHVSIEDAALDGTIAHVTVRVVSDQIAETLGKDGRPVAGADAVAEITDLWTFTRDLSQPDPAWRLTAARTG